MVTDKQVRRLFALIKTEKNQEIAASKAGMDAKTARKYRRHGGLPSELPAAVRSRTRPDPFIDVWDDVQKLFEDNAGLEAKTVFEFLQRQNPSRFQDGQVRTLQRRVKVWRATEGPAREVFFAQEHPPGRLGASDFTHMEELGASLAAILTRMVRTAMLEELGQDYIRTARAKGLSERAVICRHALPNALVVESQQVVPFEGSPRGRSVEFEASVVSHY